MVQPQLLRADLIHPVPQPDGFCGRRKTVPAGDDQVHVVRQAMGKGAQKIGHSVVGQQVKIVDKDVAGGFSRQLMAQIVRQQAPAGGILGAAVVPQEVKARPGKGVLHALPEDSNAAGIHADADDMGCLCIGALSQIPVHRRRLSIAHGRNHSGHRAAGDGPQTLLQPLGDINRIQIPF